METNYLKTFYRVTRYIHSRWKDKYPTFKIRKEYENYFQTLEEAQASVLATSKDYKLYAMVITELPYGYPCTEEEYLSRWVYRADGSLNGCVSYAELDQRDEFPGLNELGTRGCLLSPGPQTHTGSARRFLLYPPGRDSWSGW